LPFEDEAYEGDTEDADNDAIPNAVQESVPENDDVYIVEVISSSGEANDKDDA